MHLLWVHPQKVQLTLSNFLWENKIMMVSPNPIQKLMLLLYSSIHNTLSWSLRRWLCQNACCVCTEIWFWSPNLTKKMNIEVHAYNFRIRKISRFLGQTRQHTWNTQLIPVRDFVTKNKLEGIMRHDNWLWPLASTQSFTCTYTQRSLYPTINMPTHICSSLLYSQ